jgi:hypothetical protein
MPRLASIQSKKGHSTFWLSKPTEWARNNLQKLKGKLSSELGKGFPTLFFVQVIIASQQSLALHHTLLHPDTRSVAKTAGFHLDANKAMRFQWQQLKEMLAVAMSTAKQKDWVNADRAAFVETILTAVEPDMTSEEAAVFRTHLPVRQNLPNLIQLLLSRRELLLWMPNI